MTETRTRRQVFTRWLPAVALGATPLLAQAGEGWYFGLEGGGNWLESQDFRVYDYDPPILTRPVPDGSLIGSTSFDAGWLGGLTLGYALGNGFRTDLELAYRENDFKSLERYAVGPIRGSGKTTDVDGSENVASAMLNVWYDFMRNSRLHPYIGAGAGAARFEIADGRWDTVELRDRFDTKFAWQFGAGLAYELSPNWTASLDYRYLKTSSGASFDLFASNPNTRVETTYEAQSAILGLRYQFGAKSEPAVEPVAETPVEVVPVAEPPPPPPPPPPECKQPAPGEPLKLDGCKAGDKLVLHGVNFEFDQAKLTVNAKTLLDQVVSELQSHPSVSVEVDGHTDSKGSDAYNQKLSERRAESVRAYLVEHGVAADRLTAAGFGETQPIADNDSDEGREQNRRVELKIVAGDATTDSVAPPMSLSDTPEPASEPVDPLATDSGSGTP